MAFTRQAKVYALALANNVILSCVIIQVSVVLNRTVVIDIEWGFENPSGSHLQSQDDCVSSVDGICVTTLI